MPSVIAKAVELLEQKTEFDHNRVAIAGKGPGGEMALLSAFMNRTLFRGVVTIDAELTTRLPNLESLPSSRLHMLVFGGEGVGDAVEFFRKKGFSIYSEELGSGLRLRKVFGWLEILDRL